MSLKGPEDVGCQARRQECGLRRTEGAVRREQYNLDHAANLLLMRGQQIGEPSANRRGDNDHPKEGGHGGLTPARHASLPPQRTISICVASDMAGRLPGAVFAGRIEADHLGGPFTLGAMLLLRVLAPDDPLSIGTLYILDDGSDVAIVRLQAASPDLWVVDQFTDTGGTHRRTLYRKRCQPRASILVQINSSGPTQPRSQCRAFLLRGMAA